MRGLTPFGVYLALMVGLVALVPVARVAVLAVSDPVVVAWWESPGAPLTLAAGAPIVLAGLVHAGSLRGPVMSSPLRLDLLAGGPRPRRSSLAAIWWRAAAGLVAGAASLGCLVASGLLFAGAVGAVQAGQIVAQAAGFGGACALAWLAGQVLDRRARTVSAGVLLVCGTLAPILAAEDAGGAMLLALAAAVPLALALSPLALDRLRGPVLARQALAWERGIGAAAGGDVGAGLSHLAAPPSVGRGLGAVRSARSGWVRTPVQDAVGSLRAPGRLLTGAVALVAAGALLGLATSLPGPWPWALGAVAGGLAFTALGSLVDGVRFAAEAAAAPSLLGTGDLRLFAEHAVFPLVMAVVLVALGGAVLGAWNPALLPLVGSAVVGRALEALRGPMPAEALTPIPSAMGDLSGLRVFLWHAGPLTAVALVGAGAAALPAPAASLAGGVAATLMVTRLVFTLARTR